jgi:hypothetical protein
VTVEALHFSAYRGMQPGSRPDIAALKRAARERAEAARARWVAGTPVGELLEGADEPGFSFIEAGVIQEYRPRSLPKEVDRAIASLDQPGDVSPLIEVFDGAWLVRLRQRESVREDDVREALLAELRDAPIDSGEIAAKTNELMARYAPEYLLH